MNDILKPKRDSTLDPTLRPQPQTHPQPNQAIEYATPPPPVSPPTVKFQPPKRRKWVFLSVFTVILLAIGSILAVALWYKVQIQPRTQEEIFHVVTITGGSSTKDIARQLAEKAIIKNETAFQWYLKLNKVPSLQAGDYRLSSNQSVADIVTTLRDGKIDTTNVLIPPGLRLDQIEAILMRVGYEKSDIEPALKAVRNHPLLVGVPPSDLLEGYLFPETYTIGPTTSAEGLTRLMLDTFENQITSEITVGLAAQNISLHDGIILASIVQKEVPDYETQRMVAQVFIRRLKEGIPLGADPTFKYAAVMTNQPALPSLDSPYNTRIYTGLPPTAISNFNISALRAVANPSSTNYLYFVAGDDGKTHFTNTIEEHQAATRQYCTTLCQ